MESVLHPDDPRRDLALVEARVGDGGQVRPPNIVVVHPTDRCNHSCDWCWYDRSRAQIPDDLVDRVVDNSVVVPGQVGEVIIAGGGEPLLYPSIERLIVSIRGRCEKADLKLDTNGSLLRRLGLDVLRQIDYIRVSLDATDPEEYARTRHVKSDEWAKVLGNIEWVRQVAPGIQLGVSLVEHRRRTPDEIERVSELLVGMGVNWVFRKPVLGRDFRQETIAGEVDPAGSAVHTRTGGELSPLTPVPPVAVASALVMIGADAGIYPCYHQQDNSDARIARLEQVSASDSETIRSIWELHAISPHPCRIHNSWQEFHAAAGKGLKSSDRFS